MTLFTRSKWYYGHLIGFDNRIAVLDEGSGPIRAELRPRGYTLTGFANELQRSINIIAEQVYTVTVNRETRQLTISAADPFSIVISAGSSEINDAFALAGFENSSGSNEYTGSPSGREYAPQLPLQSFTNFDENVESVDSVVNESASGRVESVTFGRNRFMECDIRYATDKKIKYAVNNQSAVSELKDFLNYAITKSEIEFIPNISDPETFNSCILESTSISRNGTGYRLRESDGIPGFYDTGTLRFRERQ